MIRVIALNLYAALVGGLALDALHLAGGRDLGDTCAHSLLPGN